MKVVVGLGNPGLEHQKNRHNLGFMLMDSYARKHLGPKINWDFDKSLACELLVISYELILVKPQTFMNLSGVAIKKLLASNNLSVDDLIVAYDDLDLPLGKVRIRIGGSAAGHHGVESIINSLGDDKFIRVRVGIGDVDSREGERRPYHFNAEKYVVSPFSKSEIGRLKQMLKKGVRAMDIVLSQGVEVAQNTFN